jgi:pilus assembly protein CpaB
MSPARIIVLVVALIAGIGAAILAGGSREPAQQAAAPPPPQVSTSDILVAAADIARGGVLGADTIRWQAWPSDSVGPQMITRSSDPEAIKDYTGAIARMSVGEGEPLRAERLIKGYGSGFMSALLSPGMRAVSTEVSEETGAGGFILPNDRVDVILSRKLPDTGAGERYSSETILQNVRVLAIDQTVEDEKGEKVVVPKKTGTLELTPRQAETMALARQLGTISLALRPLSDAGAANGPDADLDPKPTGGDGITIVRFGVPTQATTR